jgi:hypothetical protein
MNAPADTRTARDRLDRILAIAGRARRFWLPAFVLFLFGAGASLAYALFRPRVYKSETLILYRDLRGAESGAVEGGDPTRKLGLRLKEMVLSRTRLEQIIREHKLYSGIVADRGYVDAVDEMRSHISFRVRDSDTFGLSFEGENPERVQEVTKKLAQAVVSDFSRSRAEQAEVTRELLDAEKRRAETDLKEREAELARFLVKHPEFARETARPAARPVKSSSAGADPTLQALEREQARLQERLAAPTAPAPAPAKKRAPEPPVVSSVDPKLLAEKQAAEAEEAAAQKELAEKLAQFTEQHPDVRAAQTRLRNAEAWRKRAEAALAAPPSTATPTPAPTTTAVAVEEATIDRGALENELRRVTEEIAAWKAKKRREGESATAAAPPVSEVSTRILALETEWTRLNRDLADARARVQQLDERQLRASIVESAAATGQVARMEIVDEAYRPTHPAKPSTLTILLIGLIASLALALAMALAMAIFDDRIYDRTDIDELALGPLVAVVPRAARAREAARG